MMATKMLIYIELSDQKLLILFLNILYMNEIQQKHGYFKGGGGDSNLKHIKMPLNVISESLK